MSDSEAAEILADQIAFFRLNVLILVIESLVYGMYAILVVQSIYILLAQGLRSRKLMLLAIAVMFSAASITWAIDVAYLLVEIPYELDIPLIMSAQLVQKWNILGSLQNCVCRLEFVFSDTIVIWRAWILWSERRSVKIILSICFAMSLCGAIADEAWRETLEYSNGGLGSDTWTASLRRASILVAPTIATNVTATSLIAYKAWAHRNMIKLHLDQGNNRREKVEKALALLVESGVIYCLLWVLYFVGASGAFTQLGNAYELVLMPQIAGIYPTIIIVLVCLNRTHCDRHFTYDLTSTVQFAPAGQANGTSGERGSVYHLRTTTGAGTWDDSSDSADPSTTVGITTVKTEGSEKNQISIVSMV